MFGLLIGNNQLISMVRMRLMLQPSVVYLIINLVSCSETFKTVEGVAADMPTRLRCELLPVRSRIVSE